MATPPEGEKGGRLVPHEVERKGGGWCGQRPGAGYVFISNTSYFKLAAPPPLPGRRLPRVTLPACRSGPDAGFPNPLPHGASHTLCQRLIPPRARADAAPPSHLFLLYMVLAFTPPRCEVFGARESVLPSTEYSSRTNRRRLFQDSAAAIAQRVSLRTRPRCHLCSEGAGRSWQRTGF